MKNTKSLPQGYRQIDRIDVQRNKKLALMLNVVGTLVGLLMIWVATAFIPLHTFHTGGKRLVNIKWIVLAAGYVAYILAHEAVHGLAMKRFCQEKANYSFHGLFAYAGSAAYYCRRDYITIGLAPVGYGALCWRWSMPWCRRPGSMWCT